MATGAGETVSTKHVYEFPCKLESRLELREKSPSRAERNSNAHAWGPYVASSQ